MSLQLLRLFNSLTCLAPSTSACVDCAPIDLAGVDECEA